MTKSRRRRPAKPKPRSLELTPEDALQLAIERHKAGQLDAAEVIYRVLLERWPDHADVLSHMGVLQHQLGQSDAALGLLRRALESAPKAPGVWNNLGNVLLGDGQVDEAEKAFRQSIGLADNAEAEANLGRLLRRRKLWSESEAACRRSIEIQPEFFDGWHNLAMVLFGQHRIAEGVKAAGKAMSLAPAAQRRHESYARALVLAGEIEQAAVVLRRWLVEEPDNAYAQHHLAACSGELPPPRASDAYVEQVFDGFAASFDRKLASLHYRAPELVTGALQAALDPPARQFDIADIGCGTGLCGPLVRPWARRLWGCDLSAAMLDRARERGAYDELLKAELTQFLVAHPASFDVVVSADTFCYFGDLHEVLRAARDALRAGGRIVFTVEALKEGDDSGVRLLSHGRYAHALAHVQAALAAAGLHRQAIVGEVLRDEFGLSVEGWLVTAGRSD